MRKFIFVLLTLLLVSPFSFAMKGIIWQPQNRDSQVTDTQWQGLMSQLRLQGFDTLVLQWTRYGDAFTQPEQRALLFKRAAAAQQAGLKLIVGLNADPEFFMHQKQSSAALESYLNRLLAADLQQARLWSAAPGVTPDGWYISAEILSNFLEQSRFIALLMYILRSSVRDSICRIIQSDIQHYWNLRIVASSLCLSPSLLKKKLKNENTSYSQIVTECRMRYAVQMLLMDNKNITQVAQLCGYSSTSYFISVFKAFYGLTPLNYLAKQRQKVMW